jgi:fatty-acyl-CoA synthase
LYRPRSRTLYDLLDEQAARLGDREAVVYAGGRISYSQLRRRSELVSRGLDGLGVGRGGRVGLLTTNRVEWLESTFGAAALGATVHAFNTWVTGREIDQLVGESECTVLVVLARHRRRDYLADLRELVPEMWEADPGEWTSRRFPALRSVVVVGGAAPRGAVAYEDWLAEAEKRPSALETRPQGGFVLTRAVDIAVVLYTSGSTARPKAVPLLHYGMVENGFHIGERMGLTQDDRVWLGSPLFWSFGCANALMATFGHGATLVLQEQFDAAEAVALIERERCTAAYLLPTLTRAIAGLEGLDVGRLASLRTGLTIGTPDDVRIAVEKLGVRDLCNVYGSTESYGNCCVTPHELDLQDRLTSQGPPLPGVDVRVVDSETGALLPVGEVGELEVRGYLTPGYLRPGGRSTPILNEDGYYHTGDLASVDENGWLHYASRGTDMIKTAGINVAPAEVEEFLLTIDGVEQVAVVGAPDPNRGEIVVAYVVARPGSGLTAERVVDSCRGQIASYKVPARVLIVAELPKTDTGKLHRKLLREEAAREGGS